MNDEFRAGQRGRGHLGRRPTGLVPPFDSEQATRFIAALEALSLNMRRAFGSALAVWGEGGRLAGRQRVGRAAVCAARLPVGTGEGRRAHAQNCAPGSLEERAHGRGLYAGGGGEAGGEVVGVCMILASR